MAISTCNCHKNGVDLNTARGCEYPVLTYEGCVLQTWENNYYDDSDFQAAVWDEESQTIKQVMYATTRGWTYHNSAVVDATDEVREKASEVLARVAFRRALYKAQERATDPTVGKTVKSLTTRGKNKGAVGTIVAREVNPYHGPYYANGYNRPEAIYNQRVKVQIHGENAMRWMDADKVQVIDPMGIDYAAEWERSVQWAQSESYISVFSKAWVS